MSVLATVVAWIAALAVCGALLWGVAVAVREGPVRAWGEGRRGDSIVLALIVVIGLFVWWAASRVVP
jgi:hypothetical protein